MGWKQSVIPQHHVCVVPQCRPKGHPLLLQLCAAPATQCRWQSGGNHVEYMFYNDSLLFKHNCDFSLPCTFPPTSIIFRCFMSKTAPLHWRPDWWLKSWEGKPCIWDQLFLLFSWPDLLSVALMQLNIWATAFSIVVDGAVFAVLDSSRLFSQQSETSYLSKEEISPTLFACVLTFWFPYSLFFKCT